MPPSSTSDSRESRGSRSSSTSSEKPRRPREVLPGGIVATRRVVRRRGGVMGWAVFVGLLVVGWLIRMIIGGSIGGGLGFLLTVIALPILPVLGLPATTGAARWMIAYAVSLVMWWFLGRLASARVSTRVVVGWKEWAGEFAMLSAGICIGSVGAVLLGSFLLGLL